MCVFFQEQLRRRQEAQERILQQNEFRRASIRGSRKLQALQDSPLQDRPVGIENDAYAEDEEIEVIAGMSNVLGVNRIFVYLHVSLYVKLDVNKLIQSKLCDVLLHSNFHITGRKSVIVLRAIDHCIRYIMQALSTCFVVVHSLQTIN